MSIKLPLLGFAALEGCFRFGFGFEILNRLIFHLFSGTFLEQEKT